ncbi:hypothetical protein ACWEN6_13960 [Sphaerisporangium sp. NPDC004334]
MNPVGGFIPDLSAILKILTPDKDGQQARAALNILASDGDTILLPAAALAQAAIIADPPVDELLWLTEFGAVQVASLTVEDVLRMPSAAQFAEHPNAVPVHHAHTAHLAADRGWPILTGDEDSWAGYDHLEFVPV